MGVSWEESPDDGIPWNVGWEHLIASAYGWTREEIGRTAAREIFWHCILIRKQESQEKRWALTASAHPKLKPAEQKANWQHAAAIAQFGTRRKTAFEMAPDDETRITMIGSEISAHGQRWVERHPRQMEWLASIGVAPEEAVRRHKAWLAAKLADPFFQPAGKPKR